jgi:hypothetical protein
MKRLCVIFTLVLTITSITFTQPSLAKTEIDQRSLLMPERSEPERFEAGHADIMLSIPTFRSSNIADTKQVLEAGEIVTARRQLMNYVLDIKEKYKPADKEYQEARKLFREVQSEYEGWLTVLVLAIHQGKARDLRKDNEYKQKAERAGKASKAFVDYAQSVTTASKSVFAFLTALTDSGIKIWNAIKDRQARERAEFAEVFEKKVKWEPWENIPPGTEKPAPAPRCQ